MSDQLSSDLASLKIDRSAAAAPPRRRSFSGLFWMLAAAALVGAGYLAWPHLEARAFKAEVRVTEVARISPSQASTSLTSTGYVVPRVLTRVGTTVTARITRVAVQEGSVVHAGDLLAELDALDAERAVAAAQSAALAAAARGATTRAELAEIELQIARQRPLVEAGGAARATVEDLEARAASVRAAVDAANAEARAARSEVDVARAALAQLRIVAPIDGTVITEPAEVGDVVGLERELLQIADLSTLVVETDVPEARLGMIRVGGPCEIVLDAFPGRRFRGETAEIGRRVDRARATVTVRVRFVDPTADVLPDMAARVSFLREALSDEQMNATARVVVPADAVTTRGGAQVVFVAEDGVARMRRVRLGAQDGAGYELLDGPAPGTRLVATPPAAMVDGQGIEERTQ